MLGINASRINYLNVVEFQNSQVLNVHVDTYAKGELPSLHVKTHGYIVKFDMSNCIC